jgi:hypothetical protein
MMNLKPYIVVAYILVLAFGAWQIVPAVSLSGKTGVLEISASTGSAKLSLSQDSSQAVVIGTGSAKLRLNPGTYLIVATDSGNRASAVAVVRQGATTTSSLKLKNNTTQHVKTIADVSFSGFDYLLNLGLSLNQQTELEQYFYQFKPAVNSVSIGTATIKQGARDPNTISPFSFTFVVSVDSTNYNATINYTDTNNVQLQLFDMNSGSMIYTAGTIGS